MQAEAQSVFYLVSIFWGSVRVVGLEVYGYQKKVGIGLMESSV